MTIHESSQLLETHTFSGSRSSENKPVAKSGSIKTIARMTGVLMLIMAVIAPFSILYVPSTLIVPEDAAATANHIIASEPLFRLSIAGDGVVFLIEIVLSALLYVLLKPVSHALAVVAGFSRLAMTIIQGINLLNNLIALLLVSGATYLTGFDPGQLNALVLLFLNAHQSVVIIWGLAFGLHLLVLGYLVYKSGYIPKLVGVLLVAASLCYLIQSFGNILLPNNAETFALVGFLSIVEIALPLWLVFKGINVENWEQRAASMA